MERKKIPPSEIAQAWYRKVWPSFRAEFFKMKSDRRQAFAAVLAGYTALIGPLGDEDAQSFLKAVKIIFPHNNRKRRWYSAAAILPADREKLIAFAKIVHGYEKLAGEGKVVSLQQGNVNLENIVYYALRFSKYPSAFLEAAGNSWMNYPGQIFSEQFFREAARSHRGAFGDFSDRDYNYNLDNVEVIE